VPQDQRIEFRIGIHVGDIIIDDNDIFGDVSISPLGLKASQSPAHLISSSAHDQVRTSSNSGLSIWVSRHLKNIARPILPMLSSGWTCARVVAYS